MGILVTVNAQFEEAFREVIPGLELTLRITLLSIASAAPLGLLLAFGRLSRFTLVQTVARVYIEFVRGVPMIVWVFTVAYAITPMVAGWLDINTRDVSYEVRGVVALASFYAAFLAEVFRGGIQSVDQGQSEAAKALGLGRVRRLSPGGAPQALRNALPALGNDFIALMKDTALLSVLAVPELTQEAALQRELVPIPRVVLRPRGHLCDPDTRVEPPPSVGRTATRHPRARRIARRTEPRQARVSSARR
ncbi:MAG: amino acid ABC transporter permease [Acidimicrobiales bacterium]